LWLEGALFPFQISQPLVALGALADLGMGLPYIVSRAIGAGTGRVVAITYEYGNTFVIVAGLLNMLVVLDVFDIAKGRK
jgi:ABC-type enterochelin transport system permease subunit